MFVKIKQSFNMKSLLKLSLWNGYVSPMFHVYKFIPETELIEGLTNRLFCWCICWPGEHEARSALTKSSARLPWLLSLIGIPTNRAGTDFTPLQNWKLHQKLDHTGILSSASVSCLSWQISSTPSFCFANLSVALTLTRQWGINKWD